MHAGHNAGAGDGFGEGDVAMSDALEKFRARARAAWEGPDIEARSMVFSDHRALAVGAICRMLTYPGKVLEIGTFNGINAAWMAQNLPSGTELWTLDRHDRIHAEKIAAFFGRMDVDIKQANFRDESQKAAWIGANGPWDLILIDADHSYAGVALDWAYARAAVGEGGIVAFDDAKIEGPGRLLKKMAKDGWPVKFLGNGSVAYVERRETNVHRAFLVTGLPGSAVRLLVKTLMLGGCAGDSGMEQRIDPVLRGECSFRDVFPRTPALLALRPDPSAKGGISGIVRKLEAAGYAVTVLVAVRSFLPLTRSRQRHGQRVGLRELSRGLRGIILDIPAGVSWFPVPVGVGFMDQERLLADLTFLTGLDFSKVGEGTWRDADAKHVK
jgi:predicted O-methyltransferase YrrM